MQRVKQGGYGSGTGCAGPPPLPAHPWCRSATEGLGVQGQVSAPSALPWPHRGLPKRPVGASAAPDLCEASSPLSSPLPPPGGRGRAHTRLPSRKACAAAHRPPLAPVEGVPCGVGSSIAAPPAAPGTTSMRGPYAHRKGRHGAPLPHPPQPRTLRWRWQGRLGVIADGRPWRVAVRCWCVRTRAMHPLHLRSLP